YNDQYLTAEESGDYQIRITDPYGCVVLSEVYSIDLYRSVYPNPSSGVIGLKIPELPGSDHHINVYNSSGKLVLSELIPANQSKGVLGLDLSSHPNGVYLIHTYNNGKQNIQKVRIQ